MRILVGELQVGDVVLQLFNLDGDSVQSIVLAVAPHETERYTYLTLSRRDGRQPQSIPVPHDISFNVVNRAGTEPAQA